METRCFSESFKVTGAGALPGPFPSLNSAPALFPLLGFAQADCDLAGRPPLPTGWPGL